MKEITIKAPRHIDCDSKEWPAKYTVYPGADTRVLLIDSRSTIEILVAKVFMPRSSGINYLISSPNFYVAIPEIGTLMDTFWITEKLRALGMPAPDAVTAAQVLADMGNF